MIEQLNGGVVQTRHPTLLRPGEVQQADEMILKPGDPALQRAPGRTSYGTVRSTGISVTTNGTTTLTSSSAFGTAIASVVVTQDSPIITKSSAFGSVVAGQSVIGTGIPAGAVVRRVVDNSTVELDVSATAGATETVTFCDIHPGTFISGSGITTGTTIASIESASSLTMSAAASNSTTASRTFSEQVQGLRALSFDNPNNDILLAKAADKLYTSPLSGLTGSFTQLLAGLSQNADAILETVQYRDRHIVLTGYDVPRVLYYKDGGSNAQAVTIRPAGMKPVTNFAGTAVVAGTWSSMLTFQNGYYWFLVTEVSNPGTDGNDTPETVESTFTGTPKVAQITDYTTQAIQITRSLTGSTTDAVNNGNYGTNQATHWRVYMAPKQADQFPMPDLSEFRRVATVNMGSASVTISDLNPWVQGYAQRLDTYGGYDGLFTAAAGLTSTNALSQVAGQSVASVSTTVNTPTITSSAAFGTVTVGMYVIGTGIPIGTTVQAKASSSSLTLSTLATASGTVTVYFGDKPSWDDVFGLVPPNVSNYRAGEFSNYGIQNQGSFSTGTITGILVEVRGQWLADNDNGDDRGFYISISKSGTISDSGVERWIHFPQGSYRTGIMSAGGQFDTWGLSLSPSDFTDGGGGGQGAIRIRLRKHSSAVAQAHYIDGVRIKVYAGGATLNLDGPAFRTIILTDQLGHSVGVGAALNPPVASTADLFDGMIVSNDTNDPSAVVACLPITDPIDIEAWPAAYRLPLGDTVKVVRRINESAVIGCLNSVKRLNYFPRETDAEFSKGRCWQDIATDHGMVGPRAAKMFTIPGRGTAIAYLSFGASGMNWTDGVTTKPLCPDIDWANLIEPTLIQRSVLEVYPQLSLLALYYVPYGGTRKTKVIYFSYHPTHIKEDFQLPAVGPVTCSGSSAAVILVNGLPRLFTGHSLDGTVYLEDSGTTDASGGTATPTVKTRRLLPVRVGAEGRVERVYVVADAAGDGTTGAFSAALWRQNQGEALTLDNTQTADTVIGGFIQLWPDFASESFEMVLSKSAAQTAAWRLHYVTVDGMTSYGQSVNG